jgi:hypothetical protein
MLRAAVLPAVAACGCSTFVVPPQQVRDPATILALDFGYHSGLVLPKPEGGAVEYAWGSRDWFAHNANGFFDLLEVLFWVTPAVQGRRELSAVPAGRREGPYYPIVVERDRVEALRARLDAEFAADGPRVYNPAVDMWFVPAARRYWLFYNCNHAVADRLRELGCDVTQTAVWAGFTIAYPPSKTGESP